MSAWTMGPTDFAAPDIGVSGHFPDEFRGAGRVQRAPTLRTLEEGTSAYLRSSPKAPGGSMMRMKVLTAKVVDGKIDVTGDLEDGSTVAVFGVSSEEPRMTAEDEEELAQALAEIRAGQFIDGQQLVADLKARTKA